LSPTTRDPADLDVEARALAEASGVRFARTQMPNADPEYCRLLAAVVREHLFNPT
jgi:protoheme ferro-lyase